MRATNPAMGRKRDPEVDLRITLAAIEVFGAAGWSGFTIDAVAKTARVSKPTVYLRWDDKEQLLIDALAGHIVDIGHLDTGTLRGDLIELARKLFDLYTGPAQKALLRMAAESSALPGIAKRWNDFQESQVLAARKIVRRGIRRGELRKDTPVSFLLDALCGGIMNHALSTPPRLWDKVSRSGETYTEQFVDFLVLTAVQREPMSRRR
ncbi:MAG: TetR/AcrR family transcriptional regulator [Mycobacterium sp.]